MKVTTGAGIVAGSCNFNKAGEGTRKKKRKQVVKKTRKYHYLNPRPALLLDGSSPERLGLRLWQLLL